SWDHSRRQSFARSPLAVHTNVMHSLSSLIEPGADAGRLRWYREKQVLVNLALLPRQKPKLLLKTFSYFKAPASRWITHTHMRLCLTCCARQLRQSHSWKIRIQSSWNLLDFCLNYSFPQLIHSLHLYQTRSRRNA